jgi:hypothetical protein
MAANKSVQIPMEKESDQIVLFTKSKEYRFMITKN